jgi:predicted PurR-regulated permease PerM
MECPWRFARLSGPYGLAMNFTRPIIFWTAMLASVIAAVVLLRSALLPFVAGGVVAYLLNPVVSRIERLGMNRLLATLGIMSIAVVAIAVLIVLTVPTIVRELSYFIESLPSYLRRLQTLTTDPSRPWLSKIVGEGLGEAERSFGEITSVAANWLGTFLHSIWSGGQALISIASLTVVAPIVACYLIFDWNRMIAAIDHWVPPVYRGTVRTLASEIDHTIRGFVRGQSSLCLALAAFYALALSLIGLKHGILIGIASGLLSFIPYLGSLTGLVIGMCVAIAQFWPNWTLVFLVLAVFFVGQSLADYVLAPYLVGRKVHLNPVWMMFALFAFGYLFGFVGLLIAGPLAAAIGVLVRFALRQYYASSLYAGFGAAAPLQEIRQPGVAGEEPWHRATREATPVGKDGIVAR